MVQQLAIHAALTLGAVGLTSCSPTGYIHNDIPIDNSYLLRVCHDGSQVLKEGDTLVLRSKFNEWTGTYDTKIAKEADLKEICPP